MPRGLVYTDFRQRYRLFKRGQRWVCAAQLSTYHAIQCLCVLLRQDQNVVTEEHAQFASALRFVQEALPQ